MSDKTKIEWSDASWNVVTGCDEVSPGCDHCYAKTFAERWRGTEGHYFEHGFDVQLRPDKMTLPLRWRKPRRIFVNSMSDLFHKDVPDEYIAKVFAVMATTPRHTYQVLTKRHGRMHSLLASDRFRQAVQRRIPHVGDDPYVTRYNTEWPLPNLWLGVSVEDQERANLRIPALLNTPAAVRFLSCEPLLGPVDLTNVRAVLGRDALSDLDVPGTTKVDWVIVGGESGRKARRMDADWARSLRDQCTAAGVPYFFKQWGAWIPGGQLPNGKPPADGEKFRLLDGQAWDEFPAVAA